MKSVPLHINIPENGKIYFISDFHLFCFPDQDSEERERKVVHFLDHIQNDASAIFFLGDTFDFWFEYQYAVPKGNIRLQAKWLDLKDRNIPIYYFSGNHDMWVSDYLSSYFGMKVFKKPQEFILNHHVPILVGHGDGLGPKDYSYKLFKLLVSSSFMIKIAEWMPHSWLFGIATFFSRKSRGNYKKQEKYSRFLGEDKEFLIIFCKEYLEKTNPQISYFIFGHRHLPLEFPLHGSKATYINTGDWVNNFTYALYQNEHISLKKYSF